MPSVQLSLLAPLKRFARITLTATLCALLIEQPLRAENGVHKTPAHQTQIQGDERILHALNRLTWGPRPGDVAAVRAMGLDHWIDLQLNPEKIDDAALDSSLAQYPAAQLSLAEVERKFPNPLMLRQMSQGKLALPEDPTLRAMVKDQLAFYAMQQEKAGKIAPGQAAAALNGEATGKKKAASSSSPDGMQGEETHKPGLPADSTLEPMTAATTSPGFARVSQDKIDAVLQQPPDQRIATVLAMPPLDLVTFRSSMAPKDLQRFTAGMTPEQREIIQSLGGSLRMVAGEAMASRMERDLYSNRQLEAVMTDFWLNHFNVFAGKNQFEPYMLAAYERETIRPHAMGRFEDLLVATAKSPAMLEYLDNFRSTGPNALASARVQRFKARQPNNPLAQVLPVGLNENYGREVMELHTLGVNGGYTQADVTMVAKVFTGWTLDRPYAGSAFTFDERRHEPGAKTVLGERIPEGGEKEGLAVLHMLASSPATARFLSTKLAVRFVSDDPPASLIDRMTASYLHSDGDIKTVLRTMFNAPEFWSSAVYRAKVKTPIEFVVSAARASGLQVQTPQALVQAVARLGMPLYGMQTPNGYGWKEADWISTGALVSRMNFSLVLSDDRLPGTRTDWSKLLGDAPAAIVPASYAVKVPADEGAGQKERRLEQILLGQPVSERTRSTVLAQSSDINIAAQAETEFDLNATGKGGKKPGAGNRDYAAMMSPNASLDRHGPDDTQTAVMAGLLLGSPEFQRR